MLECIAHGWSDWSWHPRRVRTGLSKMKDLTERSSNPLLPTSRKRTSDLLTPPIKCTAGSGTEFRSLSVTLKAPKTWSLSTLTPPTHTPRRQQGQPSPLSAQLTKRTGQPDRVS